MKENTKHKETPLKDLQEQKQKFVKQLFSQIKLQEEKRKRLQAQELQKMKKLHAKSSRVQYTEEVQDEVVPVDGDIRLGSRAYTMNCSQCHSLEPTSTDGLKGPALGLIYNRRVGSDKNYQAYSKEMLQSNFFWSAKNLYNFMYRPKDVISFTKCRLYEKGLTDESDRADLIMFLREYSHELGKNMRIRAVSEKGYDFYQTEMYATQNEVNKRESTIL